jgi:hypothetical protein
MVVAGLLQLREVTQAEVIVRIACVVSMRLKGGRATLPADLKRGELV